MTSPLRRIEASALTKELLAPATNVATFTRDELRHLESRLGTSSTEGEGLLRVDSWTLRSGLGVPESPFAWTPHFAKRSLGLAARRLVVFGVAATPQEAVAREVDRLVRLGVDQPPRSSSLAAYLASCSPALRTAAIAHGVTYATELFCAIEWKSFTRHPLIGSPDATAVLRSQGISLRGRAELICDIDDASGAQLAESRLVVMHGVIEDDTTLLLGSAALAATLASSDRTAPARMVAFFPTSGQAAVLDITENILTRTALGIAKRVENCRTSAAESLAA